MANSKTHEHIFNKEPYPEFKHLGECECGRIIIFAKEYEPIDK